MSGINWIFYEEGKKDAYGWLLNNSAGASTSASVETADIAIVNLASNVLPLNGIEMDPTMVDGSAVGKLQRKAENVASGIAGDVAQSDARVMVAHENSRDSPSIPIANLTPEHSSMRNPANMIDRSCKHFGGVNKEEVGGNNTTTLESSDFSARIAGSKSFTSTQSTRAKRRISASIVDKSKRRLREKQRGAILPTADGNEIKEDFERKKNRRVKNLAAVREFRKRKIKQLEQNEARLRRLEADNTDLKMRLKIGKEAILDEQREKQQIREQMRQMLQRNANEQEIAQFLNMYKVTYSDYGPKRREKLHFHLSRIRELLLPTQVTKLSLYSVQQGVETLACDQGIQEDLLCAPESATATMSLWDILADELAVSDEQQRQILERRAAIEKVRDDLNHTLNIVKKLKEVTDEKNTALEAQVAQLQEILTPSQATKFIIWVKENPAFMYMLDKLVKSTLHINSSNIEN